jgi:MinD-like ATPase involved in chromosome partitioning or flagellar assembly
MGDGSGSGSPKTLEDVSHLFLSSAGERGSVEVRPPEGATGDEPSGLGRSRGGRATRLFVVTGDALSPGKSTVAVNLAHALALHGHSGLLDADPRVPNARFYMGLPSWHYLSPLTGEGRPAPNVLTDSGVVVADWSVTEVAANDLIGADGTMRLELPQTGVQALEFGVVDAPLSRAVGLAEACHRSGFYIVVARPGWSGFQRAFAALSFLAAEAGAVEAGLVVNRVPGIAYGQGFSAKLALAAKRLMSMKTRFLGAVTVHPGLGSEQRERGVIVRSRPDATSALLLREIAANALSLGRSECTPDAEPARPAGTEAEHETEDRTVTAA